MNQATGSRSVVPALVIALACALLLIATSSGLLVGQRDAPSYLSSAENLALGNGYVTSYGDPGKPVDLGDPISPVVD
ncbi:MAG: hypothetical protein WBM90_13465, partial [Acidimicrobiia bacterium]